MRRLFACLMVLILLGTLSVLSAQEATEPSAPPTLTETPSLTPTFTETATLLPSETATASPSPTETATLPVIQTPPAEVTAEPSPEITAEVTPEVTIEAATDPTPGSTVTPFVTFDPEPEPPLTAVVSDAFVSSSTNAWSLGAGWSLVPVGDNFALQVTDSTQPAISNGSLYQDLAVELRLQSTSGTLLLHLRDFYTLRLSPSGQVDLYFRDTWLAGATTTPAVPGQWRHLRFAVIGTTLRAAVDGVELLALRDPNPVMNAAPVAVSAVFPPDSVPQTLLVDNIRFWIPQAQATPIPVAPLALPTGISLIEQSEYFWDWTPATSDLGWTITGGSLVTDLGIRAAWNTFQNQMYGARIELTLDQTVSVDRIIMTFSQLQSFDRITMQLLDVNGSIVRSMSANYPTLQQQTFDEVSPWQQVRTIRLSWQTSGSTSYLSTVRLIPDGVLESSPTPSPTSTTTPTETPSPTSTVTPTETPTPPFNVIAVDDTGDDGIQSQTLQSQSLGDTTTLGIEPTPIPGNDGYCTIREAIEKANYLSERATHTPPPDPLSEPFSDCAPTQSDAALEPNVIGVALYPFTYQFAEPLPPINGAVALTVRTEYPGQYATIERIDSAPPFRIFQISAMNQASLMLQNIVVRNGYAPANDNSGNGGGILNAGTLTLINSAVIDNYATGSGGGIYNTGTATITGSCITGNTSSNGTSVHSTSSMTATSNWWGVADGPSGVGLGSGDSVSNNVNYEPINPLPQTGNGQPCTKPLTVEVQVEPGLPYENRIFTVTIFNNSNVNINDFSLTLYPFTSSSDVIPLANPDENIPFRYIWRIEGYPLMNADESTLTQTATNRTVPANGALVFQFLGHSKRSGVRMIQARLESSTLSVNEMVNLPVFTNMTNLDLNGDDAGYKALIFWAIYNESSEGNYASFNPDSANIPCVRNGWTWINPQTQFEVEILRIIQNENAGSLECLESYLLDSQVMINGLLNYERNSQTSPSTYFTASYEGSLGNHPIPKNGYWNGDGPNDPYRNSNALWMTTTCWPHVNEFGITNYQTPSASYPADHIGYKAFVYHYEPEQPQLVFTLPANHDNEQAILRWLSLYLACKANEWGNSSILKDQYRFSFYQQIYLNADDPITPNINEDSVINQVVNSLYSNCPIEDLADPQGILRCDPTRGSVGRLQVNFPISEDESTTLVTNVANCSGANVPEIFGNSNVDFLTPLQSHLQAVGDPAYGGSPTTGQGYGPAYESILHPLIWIQRSSSSSYNINFCFWTTTVWQQSLTAYSYPR